MNPRYRVKRRGRAGVVVDNIAGNAYNDSFCCCHDFSFLGIKKPAFAGREKPSFQTALNIRFVYYGNRVVAEQILNIQIFARLEEITREVNTCIGVTH